MAETIRLIAERSLIYTPHHVAEELGLFEQQGLKVAVDFNSGPGGSWLADVLAAGEADIARGGVWIPIMYRGRLETLSIFAMLCNRNPQILLSRVQGTNFNWMDLYDKVVLLPAAATSQWMFLKGILIEAGIDLSRIQFVRDLDRKTTTRLWRSGFADFYLVSPPLSEELLREGYALAANIAVAGDRVPWSVYYASPKFIAHPDNLVLRFARAIHQGLEWVTTHSAKEVTNLMVKDYPNTDREVLEGSIERMKNDEVWISSIRVPKDSLRRYQGIITKFGLVNSPIPYSEIVDESIADQVEGSFIG